jgi:hypothetical protein
LARAHGGYERGHRGSQQHSPGLQGGGAGEGEAGGCSNRGCALADKMENLGGGVPGLSESHAFLCHRTSQRKPWILNTTALVPHSAPPSRILPGKGRYGRGAGGRPCSQRGGQGGPAARPGAHSGRSVALLPCTDAEAGGNLSWRLLLVQQPFLRPLAPIAGRGDGAELHGVARQGGAGPGGRRAARRGQGSCGRGGAALQVRARMQHASGRACWVHAVVEPASHF